MFGTFEPGCLVSLEGFKYISGQPWLHPVLHTPLVGMRLFTIKMAHLGEKMSEPPRRPYRATVGG